MNVKIQGKPVVFGEVLFDRFPDGSVVLGGAPFNVAWNLQALGLEPLLVTRIGNDDLGDRILSAMESWGMSVAGVQRDTRRPTGTVDVTIRGGEPAFDIAADRAYDFTSVEELPNLPGGGILYHGSLALRNSDARTTLHHILQRTASPVFLDVNLRPPWWDAGVLETAMGRARWIKMNAVELNELAPQGPSQLVDRVGLDGLIVTRGPDGAVVHVENGKQFEAGRTGPVEVVDTVGAGDAFSSVVIVGLTLGRPWPDILERAHAFASAVVGIRGATSDDPAFYSRFSFSRELS